LKLLLQYLKKNSFPYVFKPVITIKSQNGYVIQFYFIFDSTTLYSFSLTWSSLKTVCILFAMVPPPVHYRAAIRATV
jgi:hypothetical protein